MLAYCVGLDWGLWGGPTWCKSCIRQSGIGCQMSDGVSRSQVLTLGIGLGHQSYVSIMGSFYYTQLAK